MKTNQTNTQNSVSLEETIDSSFGVSAKAYYELADQAVQEKTDLEQLQTQLQQLQVLHSRSRFMVREIAYLLKVD